MQYPHQNNKRFFDDSELWQSELAFYQGEIKRLKTHIVDHYIALGMNNYEEDNFRFQFRVMEDTLLKLMESVKSHSFSRSNFLNESIVDPDEEYYGDHEDLRVEMQVFRSLYKDVKGECHIVLSNKFSKTN